MLKEKLVPKITDQILHSSLQTIQSKLLEQSRFSDQKKSKLLLYDLTRLTILKEYSSENYFKIIERLSEENHEFIQKHLCDIFWLLGISLEKLGQKPNSNSQDFEKEFSNLVNGIIKRNILRKMKIMERLEENSLFICGFINDKNKFNTKTIRTNTKLIYEQQKYNLLREESEGYSKLIFILAHIQNDKNSAEEVIQKVLSLIGFFDLDPNRVLDILLTSFSNDYHNTNYLSLIKIFNQNALPHILGFKFQNSSLINDDGDIENENYKIFMVAAQLLKHSLLSLEEILPHLSDDKKMEEFYNSKIELGGLIYKSNTQMRLNKDVVLTEVKIKEKEKEDLNELRKNDFKNFKLTLMSCLVRVNDFKNFEILYQLISPYYDPLSNRYILQAFSEFLHWLIEPVYRNISITRNLNTKFNENENIDFPQNPLNSIEQIKSVDQVITSIYYVLRFYSIGLSMDVILFTKIMRLIKSSIKQIFTSSQNTEMLEEMIQKVFLPSLSMIEETPPGLVNEIWQVISEFEYTKRYAFYNFWTLYGYKTHPRLHVISSQIMKETHKLLKTLERETYRQNGRKLAVLSNSNPCIVFDIAIRTILSYDNQISIFISTLSYSSNLSYDVISYIILKLLADPNRDRLNVMSADISPWLNNLASFVGQFYKKQHLVEFTGLLHYLTNKLKNGSTIELIVLKELILKMSGWPTLEEINDFQLHSFAGGYNLIFESNNMSTEIKNLKKSNTSLVSFFLKNNVQNSLQTSQINGNGNAHINGNGNAMDEEMPIQSKGNNEKDQFSLVFTILLLFGENRNSILFKNDLKHLKLLDSLYDKTQYLFVQFVDFLSNNSDLQSYTNLLPKIPIDKIALYYNCAPEIVFFIYRPSIKPLYELKEEEYQSYVNQFMNAFDIYQTFNQEMAELSYTSVWIDEQRFVGDLHRKIWTNITPEFYFIIWSLKLKDIYFPKERYEAELDKINKEVNKLIEELKNNNSDSQSKAKKEIEKMKNYYEILKNEMIAHQKNNELILKFIESKKNSLLEDISSTNKRDISRYLIQYCLYPRLIFSKTDALFCAKLLILFINLEIKSINILDILSKVVKFIIPSIISATEYESQNIGIFLNEFFKTITNWCDEKVWDKECKNNSCFSRNLDPSPSAPVSIYDFKKVNNFLLCKKTNFIEIFQTKDYMSCRNALIVLHAISSVYPISKENGKDLLNAILDVKEKLSDYEDLVMMAKRYTDTLSIKNESLASESQLNINDKEKKNGDKTKKKHSKERKDNKDSKRKEYKEGSKTPEMKKRNSPNGDDSKNKDRRK